MFARVAKLIGENIGVDPATIKPESNIINDLQVNSIDIVNLVCIFEEKFGIEIPDRKIKDLITVQDFVDYIDKASRESA